MESGVDLPGAGLQRIRRGVPGIPSVLNELVDGGRQLQVFLKGGPAAARSSRATDADVPKVGGGLEKWQLAKPRILPETGLRRVS